LSLDFAERTKYEQYPEMSNFLQVQAIPQIDVEIAEKGHLWTETRQVQRHCADTLNLRFTKK